LESPPEITEDSPEVIVLVEPPPTTLFADKTEAARLNF
jgi:hypothetical protein